MLVCVSFIQILACATTADFGYQYYGLSKLPDDAYTQGTLLGELATRGNPGWPDLPLSTCAPDAVVTGKCVVMLQADFYALKKELLDLKVTLSDLQKACSQTAGVSSLTIP